MAPTHEAKSYCESKCFWKGKDVQGPQKCTCYSLLPSTATMQNDTHSSPWQNGKNNKASYNNSVKTVDCKDIGFRRSGLNSHHTVMFHLQNEDYAQDLCFLDFFPDVCSDDPIIYVSAFIFSTDLRFPNFSVFFCRRAIFNTSDIRKHRCGKESLQF